MEYKQLGRTGLKVSRLCLGTMNFGPDTTEADAYRIMDRALDAGLNFFDTANVYGWKTGEGITEQIIGRYLAQGGGRREKIVLATKVYGEMGKWPNQGRLSALNIRRACEDSLRRLKTDVIDLYQMHHVDRLAPAVRVIQRHAGQEPNAGVGLVERHRGRIRHCALGEDVETAPILFGTLGVGPRKRAGGTELLDVVRKERTKAGPANVVVEQSADCQADVTDDF